ncbi:MAG: acetylxylan esterase [Planctomycetes bacterium]|nr:acetylxylan esterase [Planctomycetota bacterium]
MMSHDPAVCSKVRCTGLVLLLVVLIPTTGLALTLDQNWRFRTGDNEAWASPALDDSGWTPIAVGVPWEKASHMGYDGYAWYRLRIIVPEAMGKQAYVEHYQTVILSLGIVDDVDVTYFNGVKVGHTGSVPDDVSGHWRTFRRYEVPAKVVRWGRENVIAVRVFDNDGDGGMCEGTPTLEAPVWQDYMSVVMGVGRGDGIHEAGVPMRLSATVKNAAFESIIGEVQWRVEKDTWIKADRGAAFLEQAQSLALRPGSQKSVGVQFEPPAAGFYQVTCSFTRDGDERPVLQNMMQGYAPEAMSRANSAPPDLRAFWDEARQMLKRVPPQYKLTPVPQGGTAHTDCFLVEMRSLGDVRIRAWLEVPKTSGPHPAMLRVPGYTGAMWPMKSVADMVVLSLDIRGHGNSRDDVPGIESGGDFLLRGMNDPKSNFYRGAIMDCVRGVDFLASRTDVDASRIGVTGGSQGGMLSLATAALDKRIAVCAPDIPFVSDAMKTFHMTQWPGSIIRGWIASDPTHNTWTLAQATCRYFDSENLAGWIECPVFMGIGLQDPVCPAPTNFAGYNQIRSPKAYRVYPWAGHWLPQEHQQAKYDWVRTQFGLIK